MSESTASLGDSKERVAFDLMNLIANEDVPGAEVRKGGDSAAYHLQLYRACLMTVHGRAFPEALPDLQGRLNKTKS